MSQKLADHKPFIMSVKEPEKLKVNVPFLFVDGVPACGPDGVDALIETLPKPEKKEDVMDRIQRLLKKERILFMKGSKNSPECGFSSRIVAILKKYEENYPFDTYNIYEDEELRETLKKHSNWPTYPQLYVHGKLVGGIDIVQELEEEAELEDALA